MTQQFKKREEEHDFRTSITIPRTEETLAKLDAALKQEEKTKRIRHICSCGDPDCCIGPFTTTVYE